MSDETTPRPAHPADAAPPHCLGRINRAIDFIRADLSRTHALDDLARVAHLSPFHFHRVFRSIVGDTPAQFTRRLRLEHAATLIARDPQRALTDVALDCGFASSSDFSRAFKQHYGMPPSAFDVDAWREERRDELDRRMEEGGGPLRADVEREGENPDGFEVVLRDLPARKVAYRRVLDPFRENAVTGAAEALVAWAREVGREGGAWYGYMWEDPDVVPLADCRYDVAVECAEFPDRATTPDEIGFHEFAPMRVAEVGMDAGIDVEMRLLDWIYRVWLPTSGYVPDDQPCFEAWAGLPFAHGLERFELAIQLPVRKAGAEGLIRAPIRP